MKDGKETDHLMSSKKNKRRLNDAAAEIEAEVAARHGAPSAATKTVDEIAGMLHSPGRKAKTDAQMNAAIRRHAKAADDATKTPAAMSPEFFSVMDEILEQQRADRVSVEIREVSWGYPVQASGMVGDKAFYLRDRHGLEVKIGSPDPESAIGIKEREPYCWIPDYSVEEITRLVRLAFAEYEKQKTPRPRKRRKPSNDAG